MSKSGGKLLIIAGPSGAGKGTVEASIMKLFPDIHFSVSVTTRPKRNYEVEGKHYFFISKHEFLNKIKNNELVEWQEVYSKNGHLYGTLKSYIEKALTDGQVLLLDLDIKGGLNVKKAYPDQSISIFIKPPSLEELALRLKKRGTDSPEQIQIRLERTVEELELGRQFDYQVINADLEQAVDEIKSIIQEKIYRK